MRASDCLTVLVLMVSISIGFNVWPGSVQAQDAAIPVETPVRIKNAFNIRYGRDAQNLMSVLQPVIVKGKTGTRVMPQKIVLLVNRFGSYDNIPEREMLSIMSSSQLKIANAEFSQMGITRAKVRPKYNQNIEADIQFLVDTRKKIEAEALKPYQNQPLSASKRQWLAHQAWVNQFVGPVVEEFLLHIDENGELGSLAKSQEAFSGKVEAVNYDMSELRGSSNISRSKFTKRGVAFLDQALRRKDLKRMRAELREAFHPTYIPIPASATVFPDLEIGNRDGLLVKGESSLRPEFGSLVRTGSPYRAKMVQMARDLTEKARRVTSEPGTRKGLASSITKSATKGSNVVAALLGVFTLGTLHQAFDKAAGKVTEKIDKPEVSDNGTHLGATKLNEAAARTVH